jgi:hypothetical protein
MAKTQTQQLVPPAKAQFVDNNEAPALVLRVRLNSTRHSELDGRDHRPDLLTEDSAFRALFFRIKGGGTGSGGGPLWAPLSTRGRGVMRV